MMCPILQAPWKKRELMSSEIMILLRYEMRQSNARQKATIWALFLPSALLNIFVAPYALTPRARNTLRFMLRPPGFPLVKTTPLPSSANAKSFPAPAPSKMALIRSSENP